MAVTSDIDTYRYGTPDQAPQLDSQPIQANTIVYAGTIALIDATGYVKASDSPLSTDSCRGIVDKQTDNRSTSFFGGGLGATQVPIDTGVFWINFDNGGGAFSQADVNVTTCYVKDAQTVTKTSTTCKAGLVRAFDATLSKVAVSMGPNAAQF